MAVDSISADVLAEATVPRLADVYRLEQPQACWNCVNASCELV